MGVTVCCCGYQQFSCGLYAISIPPQHSYLYTHTENVRLTHLHTHTNTLASFENTYQNPESVIPISIRHLTSFIELSLLKPADSSITNTKTHTLLVLCKSVIAKCLTFQKIN